MKYFVQVLRIGYSQKDLLVDADSPAKAKEQALNEASNLEFSENDADYEIGYCHRTSNKNIGWRISNGSGWNHHKTADVLNNILATTSNELPDVPSGYCVLVAQISDKPLGLRCALVKLLPRIIDEEGLDDGCDGEADSWVYNNFHLDAEIIGSCKCEEQSDDRSRYFINKMRVVIAALPQPLTKS